MAAQVEVKLGRVCDGAVHCGARWDVSTLSNLQEEIPQSLHRCTLKKKPHIRVELSCAYPLSFVRAEKTRVMTLLDHNVGDARPVVLLQTDAGLPDGYQLRPGHLKPEKKHTLECYMTQKTSLI